MRVATTKAKTTHTEREQRQRCWNGHLNTAAAGDNFIVFRAPAKQTKLVEGSTACADACDCACDRHSGEGNEAIGAVPAATLSPKPLAENAGVIAWLAAKRFDALCTDALVAP